MLKTMILSAVLVIACVAQSNAQSIKLGPELGYNKAADADEGKLSFGAAVRLKLTNSLGAEGSIHYRQEDFGEGLVTVKSWPVMVSGLLYVFPVVYGAMGAGWYNAKFDFAESVGLSDQTTQEFGWHFGAGVDIPVGNKSSLTGDIRYVFLDYDFGSLPFSDTDSNFYIIKAGFLFGL